MGLSYSSKPPNAVVESFRPLFSILPKLAHHVASWVAANARSTVHFFESEKCSVPFSVARLVASEPKFVPFDSPKNNFFVYESKDNFQSFLFVISQSFVPLHHTVFVLQKRSFLVALFIHPLFSDKACCRWTNLSLICDIPGFPLLTDFYNVLLWF